MEVNGKAMTSPTSRKESSVEWHEREKAAFEIWWESGDHKFSEPAHLAAGAAWFARAYTVSEKGDTPKVVCHAEGDRCLGCDHFKGKAAGMPLCPCDPR
jgi:hypothetical protein